VNFLMLTAQCFWVIKRAFFAFNAKSLGISENG